MGFSAKRAKAVAQGKVQFCIYNEKGEIVFQDKSFLVAVQMADSLQKANPDIAYTMKLVPDNA